MRPLTLAEYRAWEQTAQRPLTDHAIGATTAGKRNGDAAASRAVTEHDEPPAPIRRTK